MSISFPYERRRIAEGDLIDPRVTLQIKTKMGYLSIKFLVDSGADVTTLPIDPYAELFNFKKNPTEKVTIGGIEGKGVDAYPFLLNVRIEETKFRLRCYFLESKIDPLLGRLDFWDLYSITFDNQKDLTIFTPTKTAF